jgi:copper chaperone CopZ
MKNLIIISAAAFLLFTTSQMCGCGCKANAQTTEKQQSANNETKTVTLKITGMTCGGCANHVSTALKKVEGVLEQEVKYPGDTAVVKYDASKTSEEKIIAAIVKAGYKAEVQKDEEQKPDDAKKKNG